MDRIYRYQRHIYDLTRRVSLVGRDQALAGIKLRHGEDLCEVGCGTGRNLIRLARRYPNARLFGVDASREMLKSARAAIAREGLAGRVEVGWGLAEEFNARGLFELDREPDRLLYSYSLSMVESWPRAVDRAIANVRPGGRIHVVDFGAMDGFSEPLRRLVRNWLGTFGAHPRPAVRLLFEALAELGKGSVVSRDLAAGYAYLLTFQTSGLPDPQEMPGRANGANRLEELEVSRRIDVER